MQRRPAVSGDRSALILAAWLAAGASASLATGAQAQDASPGGVPASEAQVVPLWTGGAPGSEGQTSEEKVIENGRNGVHRRQVSNIHNPNVTVFLPPADKANGAAVVIAPGGAHRFHSIDFEGYEVARVLGSYGVAGIVLKYRLANEMGSPYKVDVHELADAQRAVQLVRSRASEWRIDPKRIGLMGFSAGGELTTLAGTHFLEARADAADPIERFDSRPDFLALIYTGFPKAAVVTERTPPTFFAVADDDQRCTNFSLAFYQDLKKFKIPAELHIYKSGGHGFGITNRPIAVASWPARFRDWMADSGYLKSGGG